MKVKCITFELATFISFEFFYINQRNDMTSRNMTFKMTLNDQRSKVKGHLIKMILTISKSIVKFKAFTYISFEVSHN